MLASKVIFSITIVILLKALDLYFECSLENTCTTIFIFSFQLGSDRLAFTYFALFIALYYTIHAASIAFIRIFTNKIIPYKGQENFMISCLNRILSNTTQQLIVFCSLLFVINQLAIGVQGIKVHLIKFFVIGRILFSLGYLIGEITNIGYLRSIGFICTILPSIKMILLIYASRDLILK